MKPHPKLAAATLAGAVTTLVVWIANLAGVTMPPEVAAALTTLIAFTAGYLKVAA